MEETEDKAKSTVDIDKGSIEEELEKTLSPPAKAGTTFASGSTAAAATGGLVSAVSTQYHNGLPPGSTDPWNGSEVPPPKAAPVAPLPVSTQILESILTHLENTTLKDALDSPTELYFDRDKMTEG